MAFKIFIFLKSPPSTAIFIYLFISLLDLICICLFTYGSILVIHSFMQLNTCLVSYLLFFYFFYLFVYVDMPYLYVNCFMLL
jgi:hypothetical protein